MKNGTAIFNCIEKKIYLKYEEFYFILDLTSGDLEDSWGTIEFPDGTMLDYNFGWDDDSEPYLSLYGLYSEDGSDVLTIDTKDQRSISIVNVFGTQADYYGLEFKTTDKHSYKVYCGDKLLMRTKSLNKASDHCVHLEYVEKKKRENLYIVATDKNGAHKFITVEPKFRVKYSRK